MSMFAALSSTANALAAFENALTVTQNNINNSSTPGYAAQDPTFESLPFDEQSGEVGGVQAGVATDTRDRFAEQSVQSNSSQQGLAQQQVESLTSVQNLFDISGKTGIPNALSSMYTAFSNWASSPSSATNQQSVLNAAASVASAFQETASQVSQVAASTGSSLTSVVNQVNALAAQLSGYNTQIAAGDGHDPGLQAEIYNALQQLSQLTNISTLSEANGTVTVLLGNGQTSLVNGTTANTLNVSFSVPQPPPPLNPDGPPTAQVVDSRGKDITPEVTGGQVGGLLNVYNSVLPSIQGDGNTTGSLNQLAKAFADRVNSILTTGVVSSGGASGTPLFTYDSNSATTTAETLAVNPSATASNLAAGQVKVASNGATSYSSNGAALTLAGLENSTNATALSSSSLASASGTPVASSPALSMNLVVGTQKYAISLTPAENNLQGLVTAINASGAPVSASILSTQSGYYLSLSATSTGTTALQLIDPTGANTDILTTAALSGQTYSGKFGAIAAGVGTALSNATTSQTQAQDGLTQAESFRKQVSGVDLNEQAAQVLQFQQAYEAASKVLSVIDTLTQDAINIIGASQIV